MALMEAWEVVGLVILVQVALVAMEILAAGLGGKADILVEQVDLVDLVLDDQEVALVDQAQVAQGILVVPGTCVTPIAREDLVILVVQIVVAVLVIQTGLVALETSRVQTAQVVLEDLVQAALVDLVIHALTMKIVLGRNFSSSFCKVRTLNMAYWE